MIEFHIGTDPEFLLSKDGKYRSAIGIVPKRAEDEFGNPLPQDFYYDNVLAECTVKPAKTKEEFIENIRNTLKKYSKIVYPYILLPQAAQEYPKNQLRHTDAKTVGCRPENCAYAMSVVPLPIEQFKEGQLRTAGGHVHLGSTLIKTDYEALAAIRMMDLFVGTVSIFIDHDKTSPIRKSLYGKSGRYRKTSYGCEYRSIGNFWLASPKLTGLIYDLSKFVIEFLYLDKYKDLWDIDMQSITNPEIQNKKGFDVTKYHKCIGYDIDLMRSCIDNMDHVNGRKMLDFIFTLLPKTLITSIEPAMVPQNYDMYKEWKIEHKH